jgi:tight adherence protein C
MEFASNNINVTLYLSFFIIGFLLICVILFFVLRSVKKQKKITVRLDEFISKNSQAEEVTPSSRKIIQRETSGSLFSRTIASWGQEMLQFLGKFTPESMADDMDHKLTIAGNPSNLNGRLFFAIRVLVMIAGITAALLMNRDFKNIERTSLLVGILVVAISVFFPTSWLNGQVRSRQDEIRRGLPDALDMLSVCASAGLGFDQSLQKISGYWETELGLEIKRAIQEMEMGVTRAQALRNMSSRLDVNDLSQFVAIIVQAEKIGMSYADVLHSQANQLRIMRQVRAREAANSLPGKMIIPVILFIFPAMLAVLLGPVVPLLFNLF